MKVGLKTTSQNPFYGLKEAMSMKEAADKDMLSTGYLDRAWKEAGTDREKQALFHILNFDSGSITNRTPYFLGKKKIDNGGESKNKSWMVYLDWLIKNQTKTFVALLPNIVEYIGLRELLASEIRTTKGRKNVLSTWGLLQTIQDNKIAYKGLLDYLAVMYHGTFYQKWILSKHLSNPRLSKRQKRNREGVLVKGGRELQPITVKSHYATNKLWSDLTELLSLDKIEYPKNVRYTGLIEFRKEYNSDLESVLFSSKKILDLDREQFWTVLDKAPAGARYRIQRRLMDGNGKLKSKWPSKFFTWYKEWENSKLVAQKEQRALEVKKEKEGLSLEEETKLAKIKKEAKVTTGGVDLFNLMSKFVSNTGNINIRDEVVIQSILDKVNFQVNVALIVDNSGSMGGVPTTMARIATTLTLLKNPSPTFSNWFVNFGTNAEFVSEESMMVNKATNRYMTPSLTSVKGRIVDKTDTFVNNLNKVSQLINSNMGGTNLSGWAEALKKWVDNPRTVQNSQQKIEEIQSIPVFLIISDGDRMSSLSHLAA